MLGPAHADLRFWFCSTRYTVGRDRLVIRAIVLMAVPRRTMSRIAFSWSAVTFRYRPGLLPPQRLPRPRATAWPARTHSARTSVSYSATLARIRAWSRPAGDSRLNPSRRLTRSTFRSRSWSQSSQRPRAVRPSRSSRQTTTRFTSPELRANINFRIPGPSMVLPLNLSLYQITSRQESWSRVQMRLRGLALGIGGRLSGTAHLA